MNAIRFCAVAILALALAAPAFAKSASRMRLLTWPDPAKAGEVVRMQAEVDGLGDGGPAGTVRFTDGEAALGSAPLSRVGAGQGIVSGGEIHSCALSVAAGVDCWGANVSGQLGDGTRNNHRTPVEVAGLDKDVVAVVAAYAHSCALTTAGGVKCWGAGGNAPVDVSGLSSGVVAIAAGAGHSCALTHAGAVLCWGWNTFGQIGDGTTTFRPTPVAVSLPSGVVAIAAGEEHTCAVMKVGTVKCWGWNGHGQLGDGTSGGSLSRLTPVTVVGLSNAVAITASFSHSCALTRAGAVKCWGWNQNRQLGDGTSINTRRTPVQVSGLSSGVVAIAAGKNHSCALTNIGGVKCWGANWSGAIGDGTTTLRPTPVDVSGLTSGVAAIAAGRSHSCASTTTGALWCWGSNGATQLGDGSTTSKTSPSPVYRFTALVRARARLGLRSLGVGAHSLRASFRGDAAHAASTASQSQTVVP